jgi:hypothetical protein
LAGTKAGRQPKLGKSRLLPPTRVTLTLLEEFVAAPALQPPEVEVDHTLLKQYHDEMVVASNMPLPDEDDNDL